MSVVALPTVEQQYPSTDDLLITPPDNRSVSDGATVERDLDGCLRRSRERIVKGHTVSHYMSTNPPRACAIGAIWREDVSPERYRWALGHCSRTGMYTEIERWLSDTTKQAIDLLNTVALERHPEIKTHPDKNDWSGPLEWVNQSWEKDLTHHAAKVKTEILAIYDEAIDRALVV